MPMTSPGNKHPTIDDVARKAAVSTATVSRVLNRPQTVSASLRSKVAAAVTRLGYVPHAGARALMLRRSGTVGAVFPTVDNAIFATAIDALGRRLAQSDIQLLIATSGYDVLGEMRQAINLVTRGADALVLCGLCQHPDLLHFIAQRSLPCVHVMVHEPSGKHVNVGFDNAAAMAQATRYLIDLGHRRIAMLAGITQHNDRAMQRVEGVRRALQAAGLDFPEQRLVQRPYALADARAGLRQLMAQDPAPTAVVCGNDVLAFGALLEANALGLKVPAELSIVGFDDLEMARHLQPALTTVRIPTQTMWSSAADRIVAAMGGQAFPRSTEIDVALVVRQSTAPVRSEKRGP
ncbi:LacI family DNA-binding transcriptional regulator [Verminephrobacter eiseniae]|uniref:LacI family DNA-binding transcriptional regulator n=2 Tax=Verminephrobacter eiseniae TaxID=364317 RepID=UPI0010DA810F|nr:LacI family DNA-binding transcriptional regulator [Verminephrobacter eiseniae]KAB7622818.1 LacI family DNA-binding transcriptional regulator [Verminephrobacter sp. Larva24]MCW5233617.1 LacI family DNA-binding transcriptional regulator [Verminephrobacter eiseniae]MCW5294828.1 LacI family DNA-binding transcriptional regulator [Verminephrobacter eiseniae]MCW8185574.1 LacI family DNA-binding transcriptional regulator [Verminephrobacter eiseniae]MCW8222079.1 LacI family DNA-binding transcription